MQTTIAKSKWQPSSKNSKSNLQTLVTNFLHLKTSILCLKLKLDPPQKKLDTYDQKPHKESSLTSINYYSSTEEEYPSELVK